MVQVETVAQFGVVFLLFALGLEFSLSKLKVVGPVAVLGGLLQIAILMFLCGIIAMLCRAKLSEGVFVGCFLSMSSTAVVVKYLVERNSNNALHGQVTIGILIFQDCAVGILFALLPVMGGNSGILQGMISMGKLLLVLFIYLLVASILTWLFIPRFLKLMIQLSSQTNELYQLASVAFCLLSAWINQMEVAQQLLEEMLSQDLSINPGAFTSDIDRGKKKKEGTFVVSQAKAGKTEVKKLVRAKF